MRCPHCASALRAAVYEGVEIHTCSACHGEFVPGEAMQRIISTREQSFDERIGAMVATQGPSFGVPDWAHGRTLACPACDENMQVINYAGDTSVMVDRCPDCGGLWLDAEELEVIQALLEKWEEEAPARIAGVKSALDEARANAQDRVNRPIKIGRFGFLAAIVNRIIKRAA